MPKGCQGKGVFCGGRAYGHGIAVLRLIAGARRLGLDAGRLAVDAPADLVLFDADAPFVLDRFALLSKSKNTPFDGARMQGRVLGTWVGGERVFG